MIAAYRRFSRHWLAVGLGTLLALHTAPAQNLLQGARIVVTTNTSPEASDWVSQVAFPKEGRFSLQLRAEFVVKDMPASPILSLKKPDPICEWRLNGQDLIGPPKDMFFPLLEGIPSSALKIGTNILEARYSVNVYLREGKLSPANAGNYQLDLSPGDPARFEFRSGPVLGAAGHDYFIVGCRTRMPARVTLECDGRTWVSKPGVIHRLRADGLKAGNSYSYKLVARLVDGNATAESKAWTVRIPPREGAQTFVALGDARNNPKIWEHIAGEALKMKPDFAMHTGDIVGNGNDYEAWDREFLKPAAEFLATIPCFYTFGNHENNVAMLYQLFGFPQDDRSSFTETVGAVQVISLNRFENWGKGSPNLVRMEKELAASKAPFIFAITHPPAWSSGAHGNDPLGTEVHFPIFDRYGVTAEIAGHDHCYERSEPGGTTMLIAGGGGAGLYPQEKLAQNPHSKIFRSEYNFLLFKTDGGECELKAYTYGGTKTPDDQRKLELVDTRTWTARKPAAATEPTPAEK